MKLARWLNSLRARLLVGFIIPLILFMGAASAAYITIQRLLSALALEQQSQQVIARATSLKHDMARMAASKRAHHLLGDEKFKDGFHETWRRFQDNLDRFRAELEKQPEQRALVDGVAQLAADWYKVAEEDFKLFAQNPDLVEGGLKGLITRLKLRAAVQSINDINAVLNEIITAESGRLDEQRAYVRRTTREAVWVIFGATALAVLLSLLISMQCARTIAEPVAELNEAAREFRKGRFTAVTPEGPTEIAELARNFDLMALALAERDSWLQSSERRYRTYVGATSQILWITPACFDGHIDFSSWCAFTGQTEEEVCGDGWLQAVHEDDRRRYQSRWAEFLANQRESFEEELHIRRQDGCYRLFSCRAVPIYDASGAVLEWIQTCTDITDREKERELIRDKEAAEAANQAKNRFLARVSHELRTPLTTIIGMSKMLDSRVFGDLNDKQGDYIGDINHAGAHLLVLINEILDLAKIEAGHIDMSAETLAPGHALGRIASSLRPLADAKNQSMHLEVPPDGETLLTDSVRFEQVLLNLIGNAIKFTPTKGRIDVRGYWTAGMESDAERVEYSAANSLRIDVSDTGSGIRPQDQEAIWDEFQRPNGASSVEGAGIGLALSRKLVELMGGRIWLERTSEEGSCFSFTVPREASYAEAN